MLGHGPLFKQRNRPNSLDLYQLGPDFWFPMNYPPRKNKTIVQMKIKRLNSSVRSK